MEQKLKPWDELTQSGKRHRKNSWKKKLPEKYDVFCIGDYIEPFLDDELIIPGNFYVRGYIDCGNITVEGDLTVDTLDCGNITVEGNLTVYNYTISLGTNVYGDFFADSNVDCYGINVYGNFFANSDINCWFDFYVEGSFTSLGNVKCGDVFIDSNFSAFNIIYDDNISIKGQCTIINDYVKF